MFPQFPGLSFFCRVEQQTKEIKIHPQLSFEKVAINTVASVTAEKLLISKINNAETLVKPGDDEATEELKMLKQLNGNSFLTSEEPLRH